MSRVSRLMWPGIIFVLVGSLVVLHVVTLVFAVTAGAPQLVRPHADAPRPRAGWQVDLEVRRRPEGEAVLALTLLDAAGAAIGDARVHVTGGPFGLELAPLGGGRYEAAAPTAVPGRWPCRIKVERGKGTWTFDREVVVNGPEAVP